jgi:hypothetical protein
VRAPIELAIALVACGQPTATTTTTNAPIPPPVKRADTVVLDVPPWPAPRPGDKLVVTWTVASEHTSTDDAEVEFVLGAGRRSLSLGKPGGNVWPAYQSACDRRMGDDDVIQQLERTGDFARLAFVATREIDESLPRDWAVLFVVRRAAPDLLELWRVRGEKPECLPNDCRDRKLLATVPIPAAIELDESIADRDGVRDGRYHCGGDDGMDF